VSGRLAGDLRKIAAAFERLRPTPDGLSREAVADAARDALDAARALLVIVTGSDATRAEVALALGFAFEVIATAATIRALAEFRTPANVATQEAAALRFAHQARQLAASAISKAETRREG
jgi:hypothetical protein